MDLYEGMLIYKLRVGVVVRYAIIDVVGIAVAYVVI